MLFIVGLWLCAGKLLRSTCKFNACLRLNLIQVTKLLPVLIVHAATLIKWFVSTLTLVLVITLRSSICIIPIFPLHLLLLPLFILLEFLSFHMLIVSSSFRICVLHEYTLWLNVENP